MEIYNPYSIVQISEVLSKLTVRSGDQPIYNGKAVVISLLNTGLMAVVSVTLIDEWSDLNAIRGDLTQVRSESRRFVQDWETRFRINHSYQVMVSEFRAFLAETSRWADQADMSKELPREGDGRLRQDVFQELATPLMEKCQDYLAWLEDECQRIPQELAVSHRNFSQTALHPFLLRAPFVHRTFTKPLGYAGDYEMVNQILADPRQGDTTYFQIVNAFFLKASVAQAHRNRIDILLAYLRRTAELARKEGRQMKILSVGCGPAIEIQRFIEQDPHPESLAFTLLDFSAPTLDYTRSCISKVSRSTGKEVIVEYVNESVHQLLKRATFRKEGLNESSFDLVYCAGLFDYLSSRICTRLLQYFVERTWPGGWVVVSNVHAGNPQKKGMEHLLEWHLLYRNEAELEAVLPERRQDTRLFTDETGVNVFAEFRVPLLA